MSKLKNFDFWTNPSGIAANCQQFRCLATGKQAETLKNCEKQQEKAKIQLKIIENAWKLNFAPMVRKHRRARYRNPKMPHTDKTVWKP